MYIINIHKSSAWLFLVSEGNRYLVLPCLQSLLDYIVEEKLLI